MSLKLSVWKSHSPCSKIVTLLLVKQSNCLSILTRLGCIPSLLTGLIFWKNFQVSEDMKHYFSCTISSTCCVFSFLKRLVTRNPPTFLKPGRGIVRIHSILIQSLSKTERELNSFELSCDFCDCNTQLFYYSWSVSVCKIQPWWTSECLKWEEQGKEYWSC